MDIKRVLTSVLGLPLIIAIIIFGNTTIIDIFFAIVALIGIKEYFDAFEKSGKAKPVKWIGYLIALSISVLRFFHLQSSLVDDAADMINIMFVLVIFAMFVLFFHILNSGMKTNIMDSAVTLFGIIYIPVLILFLPILYSLEDGAVLLGYVLICGWRNRHICIFSGKAIRRKKT